MGKREWGREKRYGKREREREGVRKRSLGGVK